MIANNAKNDYDERLSNVNIELKFAKTEID